MVTLLPVTSHTHPGFTLVETMVMVAVITILAGLVYANIGGQKETMRTAVKTDLMTASNAIKGKKIVSNSAPASLNSYFEPSPGVIISVSNNTSTGNANYCLNGTSSKYPDILYFYTPQQGVKEGQCP